MVPSARNNFKRADFAICGAIIRHFNFHRDIFIIRARMRAAARAAEISLTNILFGDKLCT